MNHRENWLRAVEYRYPEWIPCHVSIYPLNWRAYREELSHGENGICRYFLETEESHRFF